jgi:hypothetical protein
LLAVATVAYAFVCVIFPFSRCPQANFFFAT